MKFLKQFIDIPLILVKELMTLLKKNKILAIILLVAALLRFTGTNPGYNQFHADEGITYSAAVSMIKNGNLDPLRYDYPALVPEINYLFFNIIFIPLRWVQFYATHILDIVDGLINFPLQKLEANTIFQTYVLGERNLNALIWGRYVTALFSLGNVFLIYLLTKKLFEKKLPKESKYLGLLAAFLLAFNYKHVINSHIGLPDVYNGFFVLLALLSSLNLWNKPTLKNYLVTGVLVGMSFSIKYQIFTIFPLLLTHIYVSIEKGVSLKKLLNPAFFFSLLTAGLIAIILNPYFFVHFEKAVQIVKGVSLKYGMGSKQLNLYPFSYFYHIDYGPFEFILIFAGLFWALLKFKKETLLLLSFLIPFMFVMIYYSNGGFYIRNFITTTPILMIFAALAIWGIYKFISKFFNKQIGLTTLFIILPLIIFIPARNSIISSLSYTQPWGYDIMRPWVEENLPKDVTIASHPFDAVNLKIKNNRTEFENAGAFSLAEHIENKASYLILDLNWVGYPFYFWMSYGIEDLPLYWNKPLDIMRNMYHGLATEELFRYQVHAVTKPWQAPDTHILIVKFPEWETTDFLQIKKFEFNKSLEDWSARGLINAEDNPFQFDANNGYDSKGSIVFNPIGTKFPIVRISSPKVMVKEGYLYKIEGQLKTDKKLESREREGFLRVDFYSDDADLEKVGMISSVSSRIYGTDDWIKKEVTERAPKGAKFMNISFQTHITTKTTIWLDDVLIKQSKTQVEDITTKPPYDIKPMDLNYVYPNSHGNL